MSYIEKSWVFFFTRAVFCIHWNHILYLFLKILRVIIFSYLSQVVFNLTNGVTPHDALPNKAHQIAMPSCILTMLQETERDWGRVPRGGFVTHRSPGRYILTHFTIETNQHQRLRRMRQINGEWKGWEQLNFRILRSIDPNSNTGANGTLVHGVLGEVGRRTF